MCVSGAGNREVVREGRGSERQLCLASLLPSRPLLDRIALMLHSGLSLSLSLRLRVCRVRLSFGLCVGFSIFFLGWPFLVVVVSTCIPILLGSVEVSLGVSCFVWGPRLSGERNAGWLAGEGGAREGKVGQTPGVSVYPIFSFAPRQPCARTCRLWQAFFRHFSDPILLWGVVKESDRDRQTDRQTEKEEKQERGTARESEFESAAGREGEHEGEEGGGGARGG